MDLNDGKYKDKLSHILYLADLDYDGSGNKYEWLAHAVIELLRKDSRKSE